MENIDINLNIKELKLDKKEMSVEIDINSGNKEKNDMITFDSKLNIGITNPRDNFLEEDKFIYKDNMKEVRLAVIGNVDSGKTTLVGCLTKIIRDDGRGFARQYVFNYQHEKENGRTSSIAQEIMGFKNNLQIEVGRSTEKKNSCWKEIIENSDKVVSLIDLCGHEKYLKTTMFGLTGLLPDYAMILVGTNMGVQRMTKEHLGIVISLSIPFFIVFTKIDIAPEDVKNQTISTFSTLLRKAAQKIVCKVTNSKEAITCADAILGDKICPIFQVSSVTGEGVEDLRTFISYLKPRHIENASNSIIKTSQGKLEFLIDSCFNTKVGVVYSGVVVSGTIKVGQIAMLGPDKEGHFKQVQVKTIHFKRMDVDYVECGNSCSVKLKSYDKKFEMKTDNFRKGMIILGADQPLKACMEFEVDALILHHATSIKVGYQSVIHCGIIRQTATIVGMSKDILRAGEEGTIRFRFLKSPEYLHEGDIVLFREGRTRGKGKISKLYYYVKDNKGNLNEKEKKKK